jgi:hypothetical protein
MLSVLERGGDALAEDIPGRSGLPWFAIQCGRRPDRGGSFVSHAHEGRPAKIHHRNSIVVSLEKLGIGTYFPIIRVQKRKPMRELSYQQRVSGAEIVRPYDVPLMARVLFVDKRLPHHAFDIPGIVGELKRTDGNIATIPGLQIERMRAAEVAGAIPGDTPAHLVFEVGDHVGVMDKDYLFTTIAGIVERAPDLKVDRIDPTTILRIMVGDFMGRAVAFDVEAGKLVKIDPGQRR